MWLGRKYQIVALLVSAALSGGLHAQHFFGLTGGYNVGRLIDFARVPNYVSNNNFKSGVHVSSFYETKIDAIARFKLGINYHYQHADLSVQTKSFSNHSDYSLHLLDLHLTPYFQLLNKKSFKFNFSLGVILSYNFLTRSKGKGWDIIHQAQTDTSGNLHPIKITEYWEKDVRNSNDLSRFNLGGLIGYDIRIPFNQQIDFIFQNNYQLYYTKLIKESKYAYTSLFSAKVSVGIVYTFDKN